MNASKLILVGAVSALALLSACDVKQSNNQESKSTSEQDSRHAYMAKKSPPATETRRAQSAAGAKMYAPPPGHWSPGPRDRERYADITDNPVKAVAEHPVSTFSVDVDTGSYANVRRFLIDGQLPPEDAVRIEEMINYFSYAYPPAADEARPFSVNYDLATTPWNAETVLLRVGLKGFEVDQSQRKPANLVFLLDVSGSMNSPKKLPLVVSAMKLLTGGLTENDRVSIVVYAGASGVVLEPTPGNEAGAIKAALDQLRAGGSTAGGAGLKLAYAMAEKAFIEDGINRVILASDGDFNVGISDVGRLQDVIKRKREKGIALTTLGFGTGNLNEPMMERLADVGNGNYAYIDSAREARKVLVEQISGTLQTIAKDVKIQIEFNPAQVAEYRLIGYVNRQLRREDFDNDKVDAGEIGAGHTVTALYELTPVGSAARQLKPLRYGEAAVARDANPAEFGHLRLRYKMPGGHESELVTQPLSSQALSQAGAAKGDLAFAAAVAAFGQKLRGGTYLKNFGYGEIVDLAETGLSQAPSLYRREFLELAKLAGDLTERN